jgi:hypothetical protein
MRTRQKYVNFYVTSIDPAFQIAAAAASGSFDVLNKTVDGYQLADGEYEFWFVADYGSVTKREIFRGWKVSGKTIYWDRRVSPNGAQLHEGSSTIQINDAAEILNYLSAQCDDFGHVEATPAALTVVAKGGLVSKDVTLATATFALAPSTTTYVVYDFGLRAFAAVASVAEPNNYFVLASVVTGLAAVTSVTDLRPAFFGYKSTGSGVRYLCDDGTYKELVGPVGGGIAFQMDGSAVGTFGTLDVLYSTGLKVVSDPANGRARLSLDPTLALSKTGAVSTGTGSAYVLTLPVAPASLYAGLRVGFRAHAANPGPCTLNVNGLGDVEIRHNGSKIKQQGGDILSGQVMDLVYDGQYWLTIATMPSFWDSSDGPLSFEAIAANDAVSFLRQTAEGAATVAVPVGFAGDKATFKRGYLLATDGATSISTMDFVLSKTGTPASTFGFRLETDVNGVPSGTLVHANATGTVAPGTVTTTLAKYTASFAGAFVPSAKCWLVIWHGTYASPTADGANYWNIGADNTGYGSLAVYDLGTGWGRATAYTETSPSKVSSSFTGASTTITANANGWIRSIDAYGLNNGSNISINGTLGTKVGGTVYHNYPIVAGQTYTIVSVGESIGDYSGSTKAAQNNALFLWPSITAGTPIVAAQITGVALAAGANYEGVGLFFSHLAMAAMVCKGIDNATKRDNFIGFAKEAVASGENVALAVTGVKGGLSGLAAGMPYFLSQSSAGQVSRNGSVQVGIAQSSTEMVIDPNNGSPMVGTAAAHQGVVAVNFIQAASSLGEKSAPAGASATKVKEILIKQGGTYRVGFRLRSTSVSGTAVGQIYKNGVAVGTSRSTTATTYSAGTTYEENITCNAGDLLQLYTYCIQPSFQGCVDGLQVSYYPYDTDKMEVTLN